MLYQEIDFCDPVDIFRHFADIPGSIFLDSALVSPENRFSFICIDPFLRIQAKNGDVLVDDKTYSGNPFAMLKKYLQQYSLEIDATLCPFQGGIAGYFGYDLSQHLESLTKPLIDDLKFPDLCVGFYDLVIGFDVHAKKGWIFSSGYPEKEDAARKKRALSRMRFFHQIQQKNAKISLKFTGIQAKLASNFDHHAYVANVKKAIAYIMEGDIFQVNLSQRFKGQLHPDDHPFALYTRLRDINPAPFAAYVNFAPTVIASASPERFLKLQQGWVETKPIKGTRPRGDTTHNDNLLKQQLLTSQKDRAENIMIVDLMRNDLSRVCRDHSVHVPKCCELESFATVHHLVSTVTGELRNNHCALDLLMATFPGGSVTGAPKIRAMDIITEIERVARGPYCGSIGYLGFNGDMDTSITIRTFALQNQQVTFHVGGAIVADSDPIQEYEETLDKGRALMAALGTREP
jgi:para-aminobenzoate synthetase component 1